MRYIKDNWLTILFFAITYGVGAYLEYLAYGKIGYNIFWTFSGGLIPSVPIIAWTVAMIFGVRWLVHKLSESNNREEK